MSPSEIAHRVRYRLVLSTERRLHARGAYQRPDRLRRALIPALRGRSDWRKALLTARSAGTPGFFAGVYDRARMQALFGSQYALEREQSAANAMQARRHVIEFFGETFSYGPVIDWHKDPPSDRRWPATYHASIPLVNTPFGDVKYVWEINRHQFFVDLAKHGFIEGDAASVAELHELLAGWMGANPFGTGVSWSCALEPAFRVFSWLWCYYLCREAAHLDDAAHCAWLTGFYDHGRFLDRHLEAFSSPYNHLAGEAAALYMLGVLFPEFSAAGRWRRRGREILESTVGRQFHSDGASVEQSTFYHHATLGFYLMAALTGRNNGEEFSRSVWAAIERALEFSMHIAWPGGSVPAVGGADDGKPIRLEHVPLWDFRPLLAAGAVLFGRRDFRFAAGHFWEDALWLLGPDGLRGFDSIVPGTPGATTRLFPESGYAIARTGWGASADYVCFDCGPQAAGLRRDAVPSAAHGHADCLSVIAALDGRQVLVDPGFFCYNGDPAWEVHFRRTAAHNTVSIDSRDQAQHVSKMAWARTYSVRLEGWSGAARLAWARASHDGYARETDGVVHRRTVWLRPDGYVIIYDELTGAGTHPGRAIFQFAPGRLELDSGCAVLDERFELAWFPSVPVAASVACGGEGPSEGWIARSLGVREAAPRLALDFRMQNGRATLLTILSDRWRQAVPGRRCARAADVEAGPHGSLVARVAGSGWDDWVVADGGRLARVGKCETDADLCVIRVQEGRMLDAERIGGTRLLWDGRACNTDRAGAGLGEPHAN